MNKLFNINYSLYAGSLFVSIILFLCVFGPILAPHSLTEMLETQYTNGKVLAPPIQPFINDSYPLGTDKWGYDLMTMILYGIRFTVFVALAVTCIKMLLGTVMGLYAGMWKKTPSWVGAFENAWSYIPLFLILYFFMRPISFNSQLSSSTLIGYFIMIASVISIPSIVSTVRLKTAELNKSVYIEAANVLGARKNRLIWKHIFPQMKETLLVMFILEIVYVITIMGQLSLMNIFIGGTTVRFDPLIYLSVTKELSGLVGQARGNINGNTHILMTPLMVLLFTTISFSLLANGLKNRFQANYSRTPWIQTGQTQRIKPIRKQLNQKRKRLLPKGERLAFAFLVMVFIGAGVYVIATKDKDVGVKNDSKAYYDMHVEMDAKGVFHTTANIQIKNISDDNWEDITFYFIPNAFIKGHPYQSVKGYSTVQMNEIMINGDQATYSLDNDNLIISIPSSMQKKKKHQVKIEYAITIPNEGVRLSKEKENYYLAHWYPMLATYQNGKWNKEDYDDGMETFHTDFANFEVTYKIPEGYSLISSSDKDPRIEESEGKIKVKKVRDFFIGIVKDMDIHETEANDGVKIRLFTKTDHQKNIKETLELARDALSFYQENIGKYPHKQLDIILDNGPFMEYSGVVTINPYIEDVYFYKNAIVHEIAHQYFYGVVANDQYHQAWVDEGMTEFATSMYFYAGKNQSRREAFRIPYNRIERIEAANPPIGRQYSNVSLDKVKNTGFIYGQPAIEMLKMMEDKYRLKGDDVKEVSMQFLSSYYEHFKYKEVDTKEFIRFTKDYFSVPTGYFNKWLDTSEH
ncbi:ABC transporter permease subunit [Bacillus sp. DTU_2020_1000418_1_SI_GHA_SEK_038]|uniref:ABC transporter permease subunit n=1 Tax=Bacillus sp. DTU_2020_1000418_1_SI_GHA_SEK_038 TaxID=3077585 RepID=UPI0028EC9DC3|nr:ABC transporter permease subunit [Bacillus sp. DTU_2020_1000418_1_SI_GHA_SEK_038]WNS73989.1 ABC transporter permease subunit [Bacillus sp. DTU_2020_1000418_1_SI_GHA_SEK_038]